MIKSQRYRSECMNVRLINETTNDTFVLGHPFAHHKKTSLWALSQSEHFRNHHYIGFFKDDTLKATAIIFSKRSLVGPWWYIPYGPCVDYLDKTLLSEVMKALYDYAKAQRVVLLQFETNVMRLEHDQKGHVVPNGFDHQWVTDVIEKQGFTHWGYHYGYAGNIQPRFTYILDIRPSMDELLKNMHKSILVTHKKNLRRHITVYESDASKLNVLTTFGNQLSDDNDFMAKKEADFKRILDVYQDQAVYIVATMDVSKAIQTIDQEINQARQAIDKSKDNPKKQGFINEMQSLIMALQTEKASYQEQFGTAKTVDVGAGLYVYSGEHSYDLYMYTIKKVGNLSPAIAIHLKAIEVMKDKGVNYHDFVGISGSIDPKDQFYGLYDFKRKFGGDFIEYLGQFDGLIKPKQAKLLWNYHFQKRRLQRRLVRFYKQLKRKKSS